MAGNPHSVISLMCGRGGPDYLVKTLKDEITKMRLMIMKILYGRNLKS